MAIRRNAQRQGFTLIELMLVVAILGLLSAIAIPKMAQLVAKANASTTRGNLGAIRSVLSIYYSETEGNYPVDTLGCLTVGAKYLTTLPAAVLPAMPGYSPGHPTTNFVTPPGLFSFIFLRDLGGWGYENLPQGALDLFTLTIVPWGYVVINCSHHDSNGNIWMYE